MKSLSTSSAAIRLRLGLRSGLLLGLGLGLLAAGHARAQAASTYQLTAATGNFIPLAGGTAVPAVLGDDVVSGSLPLGFTFAFEGVSFTTFKVSSNGLLGFGSSLSNVGAALTNTLTTHSLDNGSLPVLAPFWTDLDGEAGTGASAQYATSGAAPYRVLTMEWLNYKDLNGDADQYISFQVKLHETTGQVEYAYRKGPGGEAGDATIGLKGKDGSFLSLNNVSASPATSTTISYDRLNRPATGQLYAFAPPAALATAPALTAAQVALFPNPAHGAFTVVVPGSPAPTAVAAELLNSLGQVVRRPAAGLPANGGSFMVGTAGLAAGVYTLRLQAGPTTLTKRVVLQ
ncbi:MAG: T9SS type A sorting domain-containing protein [Hymenobacter sp.]|nr:MAG: T9SS type A sorting domain-containing protein [Hymenobacter sp.]